MNDAAKRILEIRQQINALNVELAQLTRQVGDDFCSAWAIIVDGKLHSARATEHEARVVGFNFSDNKTVEIIPCTLSASRSLLPHGDIHNGIA
jgi:hypothetical protein